jgi:hypothetical protein
MSYFPNRATYINRMVTFYENISVGDEEEDEKDEVIKQLKLVTSHNGNQFRSSLSPNSKRALSTSISPPSNNQGRNVEKNREKQRENVHSSLNDNRKSNYLYDCLKSVKSKQLKRYDLRMNVFCNSLD